MADIVIQIANPELANVRLLIEELDAYQLSLYPAESLHLLSVDELKTANATFLLATVDGESAGCGAFIARGEHAEIKRVYVAAAYRGLGLGRRLLEELEKRIRAAGVFQARLETGALQPEALGLYEKAGYVRCEPFDTVAADPLSVFMRKCLG